MNNTMDNIKKVTIFHPKYSVVDYNSATEIIISNAKKHKSFGVSALAVHGLITSIKDKNLNKIINKIDLIVPDGQPVKWAMNSFHKTNLKDRVYGPTLTLKVLEKANTEKLNIFLFGSTEYTLNKFQSFIKSTYPDINISGVHIDRFREATAEEDLDDIKNINTSDANIVLVGRGCPRQEYWVANHIGKVNAVMMAVGAAFDFHAGTLRQAPHWIQNAGLEWLFRLLIEPKRLWKRYFITNTYFIYLFLKHKLLMQR